MTEQELEKLYTDAYKSVYWTAISILKNKEEAEDVVQDTFITAYGSYDTLKDKSKAVAWVKKIAANKCLNIVTRRKTFNAEEEFLENTEAIGEDFLPSSMVESREKRKIIMDIINNTLSEESRITLILFYFDEMSIKEIAEKLNIPQGTVLSRLNYAKKKIKKEVEKYEEKNDDKLFAGAAPFLFLLFAKEAEQIPFVPMAAAIKSAASAKGAAATTAKTVAKKASKGLLVKGIAAGLAATVVLGGAGFLAYKFVIKGDKTSKRAGETSETYEIAEETDPPINVLGMTPDLLNLEGGYVRHTMYHHISEDEYEQQDDLYYDADGRLVLDCRYNEDGVVVYSDYFIYDDEDRVIREELWDTTNNPRGLYITSTYGPNGLTRQESGVFEQQPDHYHVFEYDDQGRIILDTEYSVEFDTSYWYCEYVYEDDGTYTTHVTSFDVYRQEMIDDGNYNRYSADGVLLEEYWNARSQLEVYNYDDNGVLLTVEKYYGSTLNHTTTYEYDDQGRLVRDYTEFPGHDPYEENIYTYEDL